MFGLKRTKKTEAPQGGESAVHKSDEWPNWFNSLQYLEFGLVVTLTICLAAVAGVWLVFIFSGYGSEIYFRLGDAIRELNISWKVGLLILVPLYFRPVFKFLFYLKEGPFGLKADRPVAPPTEIANYTGSSGKN